MLQPPRKPGKRLGYQEKAAKLGKQVPDIHPKDLWIREKQQKKFWKKNEGEKKKHLQSNFQAIMV